MSADDQIKAWAASRLNIDPESIQKVEFEHEEGYWRSEYTYESACDSARVRCAGNRTLYIGFSGLDFFDIVREILEVAGKSRLTGVPRN